MAEPKKKRPSSSIYKGVNLNKRSGKWESSVTIDGTRHECGGHETERDAVKARDKLILTKGFNVPTQVLTRVVVNQE